MYILNMLNGWFFCDIFTGNVVRHVEPGVTIIQPCTHGLGHYRITKLGASAS